MHNLLAMSHLPTKPTQGRKSLVDYSRSHIGTSIEYWGSYKKRQLTKQQQNNIVKQNERRGKKIKLKKQ
jgi:hypothetical protein